MPGPRVLRGRLALCNWGLDNTELLPKTAHRGDRDVPNGGKWDPGHHPLAGRLDASGTRQTAGFTSLILQRFRFCVAAGYYVTTTDFERGLLETSKNW